MAERIEIKDETWDYHVPDELLNESEKIKDYVKINDDGNIIFPDGTIGSHISDHLRYYFNSPGAERPRDSKEFASLLSINDATNSGDNKNKDTKSTIVKWIKLKK